MLEAWRDETVVRFTEIGDDGRFRLQGLSAGRYQLRVLAGDRRTVRATVEAETGGSELTIDAGGE
jgi:hypothetical protein